MRLRFLGKNSVPGDSPTLYATDRYSFVVQGWKVTDPEVLAKLDPPADETCVEVPAALFVHLAKDGLRGAIAHWAPPIVHVTGEGTYIVQGRRVTDTEARAQMSIPEFEDCVEVTRPPSERYCWRRTVLELITSEQRDELITTFAGRDAFHLELKDAYATAIGDGPFAQWLKGAPDDFAWLQPWQTRIRNATQAGKTVRRVRVISEPITDYIRWEHTSTVLNLEVGEDIRWLPRHLLPGEIVFPVDGHDWWLFDDRLVAVGHFRDDGKVRGHEVITDRAVVADCIRVRDQLWAIAIPHSNYEPI